MWASRLRAGGYGLSPDHRESRGVTQEDDLAVSAKESLQGLKGTRSVEFGGSPASILGGSWCQSRSRPLASFAAVVIRHQQHQWLAGRLCTAEPAHRLAACPGCGCRGVDLVGPCPALGPQFATDRARQRVERVPEAVGIFVTGSEEACHLVAIQHPCPAGSGHRRIARLSGRWGVDRCADAFDNDVCCGGHVVIARASGSGLWVAARDQQRYQAGTDRHLRPAFCTRWCRACRCHGYRVRIRAAGCRPAS